MTDDEKWREDGRRNGWAITNPPARVWRLWGVRHIRWAWHSWRMARHYDRWASVGIGFGVKQSDLWWLYAIRRGWA